MLRTALRPVAVVSVAAAVALALLAAPAARLLAGGGLGQAGARPAEVATALRLLAVALPFAALLDTLPGATRGYRAMGPTIAVDRIGRPLLQLAGIGVAAAAGSAALLAPLWALPYLPAAVVVWLWLRRIRRQQQPRPKPEPPDPAPARRRRWGSGGSPCRGGWPRWRRSPFSASTSSWSPSCAARRWPPSTPPRPGSWWSASSATRPSAMAAQPRFTEMFASGDNRAANQVYQATTAWLILLTWPLYLLAVSFGPQVIAVFGRSYRAGATVMLILGLTMLLATACGQVDMVLVTTGRSSWSLVNGLLAVAVNVGLDMR